MFRRFASLLHRKRPRRHVPPGRFDSGLRSGLSNMSKDSGGGALKGLPVVCRDGLIVAVPASARYR